MSSYAGIAPEPLQSEHITAKIIRQQIYKPAKFGNDWRCFVIVGREGTGKSLTCASILQACDPTFGPEDVHFEPDEFLEDISANTDEPGRAVMSDETGVGFGNRTWHDREQVEANQALQTARDDNRIVGLTAPRLEEIDKQLRGRIHVMIETVAKKDGEWVEVKWKTMNPTRDGYDEVLQKYPRKRVGGRKSRVSRLKIGPPSDDFIEGYEEKKARWKDDLFDRVIGRYRGEDEDEGEDATPKEIAEEVINGDGVEAYISDNHGQKYIDKDLIAAEFGIGDRRSKKVKKLLLKEVDDDVI